MLTQLGDLWENVRVALDGLLANKLRSALTMLGVIIGVAAVIALMSIGAGVQDEITGQISSLGTNILIVMPSQRASVGHGGGGEAAWITVDDVEALSDPANVPDASLVVPEYGVSGQIIYGDENFSVSAVGTTPDYQELYASGGGGCYRDCLKAVFQKFDLLIVGYSLADPDMSYILDLAKEGASPASGKVRQPVDHRRLMRPEVPDHISSSLNAIHIDPAIFLKDCVRGEERSDLLLFHARIEIIR